MWRPFGRDDDATSYSSSMTSLGTCVRISDQTLFSVREKPKYPIINLYSYNVAYYSRHERY